MRVLAVDDEPIVLELLGSVLKTAGYTDVVFALSSAEALKIVRASPAQFDCFMLDIVMPGMDGIELCTTLRQMKEHKSTPIIMISRMTDKHHFDKAFAVGASDYVTKPFDGIELGTRVRLAEKLSLQQKKINYVDAQVKDLKAVLLEKQKVRLSAAFVLDDVEGAVENLALENYLLSLSGGLYGMQFLAFKIANVEDIHRKANGDEFRHMINSVADMIAKDLSDASFFISYAGNGLFSCIRQGRNIRAKEDVTKSLLKKFEECTFDLASGDTVKIEIVVGVSGDHKIVASGKTVSLLREAAANAEKLAEKFPLRAAFGVAGKQPSSGLVSRVLGAL